MKIHLCLISSQLIPNLIPLFKQTLRPNAVICLVSPDMQEVFQNFRSILAKERIEVIEKTISPLDWKDCEDKILSITEEYQDHELILNSTGGTKIMAFAAYEIFRKKKLEILYVDTQNSKILCYKGDRIHEINFTNEINTDYYLMCYGQEISSFQNYSEKYNFDYSNLLKIKKDKWKYFYKRIQNYQNHKDYPLELDYSNGYEAIIDFFESKNILLKKKGNQISFPNKESYTFVTGGWLESYLYFTLIRVLKDSGAEILSRVQVKGKAGSNEYDVTVMYHNRLYLFECKSGSLSLKNKSTERSDDTVYKLFSLIKSSGLFANGILFSHQKLRSQDRTRANNYGIKILDNTESPEEDLSSLWKIF